MPFAGTLDRWKRHAVVPRRVRRALNQSAGVSEILDSVSIAFGIHSELLSCGYFVGYDGDPVYYREHLDGTDVKLDEFTELHFQTNSN